MSEKYFKVVEHVIEAQHIREYMRATLDSQEEVLHLAVKQYIPLNNPNPQPGDVTIIGAHANGFPKELYEPLWDEILSLSETHGYRIRNIFIADAAHQGQSSVLNGDKIGNDPSWLDHPRDMLHMINHFRKDMPQPLIGIGHSYGGNNLVNISLMHPRLFSGHVLLDPVIQGPPSNPGEGPPKASTFRRDLWPSREEAVAGFVKSPFYQSWDPRCLEAWNKYGIIETPTSIYPDEKGSVTLTTTKHQEVFTFFRPLFTDPVNGALSQLTQISHPDRDPDITPGHSFYSPVPYSTLKLLEHLRPQVMYVFGEISPMNPAAKREEKMRITGAGVGGSGGAKAGRVQETTLKKVGHLVAMEDPVGTAKAAAKLAQVVVAEWKEEARKYDEWKKLSKIQRQTVSEEWMKRMGGQPKRKNADPAKL